MDPEKRGLRSGHAQGSSKFLEGDGELRMVSHLSDRTIRMEETRGIELPNGSLIPITVESHSTTQPQALNLL